jgi:hypothetical protein
MYLQETKSTTKRGVRAVLYLHGKAFIILGLSHLISAVQNEFEKERISSAL